MHELLLFTMLTVLHVQSTVHIQITVVDSFIVSNGMYAWLLYNLHSTSDTKSDKKVEQRVSVV